jgi:hypothetical protein
MDYEIANTYFQYDPKTGSITRKSASIRSNGRTHSQNVGKNACVKKMNGYLACSVTHDGVGYQILAHRLAWLLTYGRHPLDQIDHINGKRNDNRIENLREVSASGNQRNRNQKAGKDKDLPIGIYRKVRKGRKGLWYLVFCQGNAKKLSTYVRNYEDALKARSRFESILWGKAA